jgi:flagellar biosynthesis protein FliQ
MNQDVAIQLGVDALIVTLKVSAPFLLSGLLVGLLVSVFQAATQIQEQTLSFIPKIAGLAVVLVVGGPWMLGELLNWTEGLYASIPKLVGG